MAYAHKKSNLHSGDPINPQLSHTPFKYSNLLVLFFLILRAQEPLRRILRVYSAIKQPEINMNVKESNYAMYVFTCLFALNSQCLYTLIAHSEIYQFMNNIENTNVLLLKGL